MSIDMNITLGDIFVGLCGLLPVSFIYWLTSSRDAKVAAFKLKQARAVEVVIRTDLGNLLDQTKRIDQDNAYEEARNILSELRTLVEYGEFSRQNLLNEFGTHAFLQVGNLRRIVYHFESRMRKMLDPIHAETKGPIIKNRIAVDSEIISGEVKTRYERYCKHHPRGVPNSPLYKY